MGIKHVEPADATFSDEGLEQWNKDHDFVEGGGDTLVVGNIDEGDTLVRNGDTIEGAASASGEGVSFPGIPSMTGVEFVKLKGDALGAGNHDLYTVPAGKRLLVGAVSGYFPAPDDSEWYLQIKIGGTYRPISALLTNSGVTSDSNGGSVAYIAEAGEVVSVNVSVNVDGALNVLGRGVLFDDTVGIFSAKNAGLTLANGDNTIYTVPPGKTAMLFDATGWILAIVANSLLLSGNAVFSWNIVDSGDAPSDDNRVADAVDAGSTTIWGTYAQVALEAGDFVSINVDVGTSAQLAWVNVVEM